MRYMLMALTCFVASSLTAEKIGTVEYKLPKQATEWKVANELEGEKLKSTTLIYVPGDATLENAKETFGVVKVDLPSGIVDKASVQKMYEQQFPGLKVNVTILEQTSESITYEWSLSEGDKEGVHGWTRIFTGPDQTVLMTYQTEEVGDLKGKGEIWLKALKEAKIIVEPAVEARKL